VERFLGYEIPFDRIASGLVEALHAHDARAVAGPDGLWELWEADRWARAFARGLAPAPPRAAS
jgi:hypothetical protein